MAGIGLAQMERYFEMLKRRKGIILRFDVAFKLLGIKVLPHYTEEHYSSGHLSQEFQGRIWNRDRRSL